MSESTGLEIAVIGYACRFPGAPDAAAFWHNLVDAICSVKHFSERELLDAGVAEAALNDRNYVRARGVIEQAEAFDAAFFGYSPRQAQLMDPQFRLLHECAWTCLEHSGIDPITTDQSIGLYAGAADNTWWNALSLLNRYGNEAEQFAGEQLCNRDFLCTLVAHKLNLKGPAVVIQSACSTSLLAVHTACHALLTGDCRIALAGGVALGYPFNRGYRYEEGMIFSADGKCRPFDSKANGTVPGEGVGLVALKPLKKAIADSDCIHAVIRATASNNDGSRKVAYTAPSVEAQAEVIRTALRLARVPAETIGYLEAHGTGTPLGDPVEIAALARAFDSSRLGFCRIGSVKSNIGHLDTAAGIAGLLKTVLALEFGHIPKSLHFRSPNSAAGLSETPFRVAADGMEWPALQGSPRRAGVSSFGIGGTNVHAILEEAPPTEPRDDISRQQMLVFSAKSAPALDRLTVRIAAALRDRPELSCADVAYTLQTGRAGFEYRATVVASGLDQVADALEGRAAPLMTRGRAPKTAPDLVFMFPGQGSQYLEMGAGLYDEAPIFREHIDHCFDVLAPYAPTGLSWQGFIAPPASMRREYEAALRRTEVVQPLLFAIEYAMAQLALSWGLKPIAMIGHSLGEYTAACLAGVFTVDQTLDLLAYRGRLMGELPSGSMLSTNAPLTVLLPLLDGVSIAAINGADQHVVSGPPSAIAGLEAGLKQRGFHAVPLDVSHAFHSGMMDPILDRLATRIAELGPRPPRIPFISCLSGSWITAEEATDPRYWASQLRQTVNFAGGLDTIRSSHNPALLEIGPGGALSALARRRFSSTLPIQPTIRHRDHAIADRAFLLEAAATLWRHGVCLDWRGLHGSPRRKVGLPGYPFERTIHTLKGDPERLLSGTPSSQAGREADVHLYGLSWRRIWPAIAGTASLGTPSQWAIITRDDKFGREIAGLLGQSGHRPVVLDPDSPVTELHLESHHILFLAPDIDALAENTISLGLLPLIRLLRALDKHGWARGGRFTVVTRSAFAVSGTERCEPAWALLTGVCQTAAAEFPQWRCHSIDVDQADLGQSTANLILQICTREDPPARAACRGGLIWEPTQERLPPVSNGPSPLRSGGIYLITGGLGGIGLTLALSLARDFKAGVALVSLSGLRDGCDDARLGSWEGGPKPLIMAADVAEPDQMRDVFQRARQHFGKLDGVIHAAGTASGRLLREQSDAEVRAALRAKVDGTLVVEQLLDDYEFFALMSSVDAWIPGPGQAAYAAANAFLDSFAAHRRSLGKPVFSINWDTWREVGMAERFAQGTGIPLDHGLSPSQGYDAFRRALQSGNPNILVSVGDWERRATRRLVDVRATPIAAAVGGAAEVSQQIRDIWKSLFGVDDVDTNQNFFELGATSFDIVQLTGRLQMALSREIAPTMLYNHPTINALARHLAESNSARPGSTSADSGRRGRNLLTQRARIEMTP
ncbi:SDR family NAD(P)-dependent oxidoreductase [Bradyrhizobium ontarionense]|uniref:SDR family NAD(P)-dependent oxidoreductase n=1 Tax=Bradyrhizobium ontarionense TaxID=2898149 RepID=A0ABY3RBF0_9BRAD|nr:type I polyketide synthase [Bradyrhizobium sp. A19]UFZ04087.1 SDR family NAD(P)-dependent oxidoreductase [Bradyrhizobium sp. A19]